VDQIASYVRDGPNADDPNRICGVASALDEMETTLDMFADPSPRFNKERLALLEEVDNTWRYIQVNRDKTVHSKARLCFINCAGVSAAVL
jgi:hypothetical protein